MADPAPGGKVVLVVEDDRLAREALCAILQGAGYAARGAADGAEALGALRRGALPDLILLDLMMPVLDGWQFRREQLRDPGLAGVPVVICSSPAGTAGSTRRLWPHTGSSTSRSSRRNCLPWSVR